MLNNDAPQTLLPPAQSSNSCYLHEPYIKEEKGIGNACHMTSRFTMFCTLCGRNPLKSRRVTPRLLKRLGYFQQSVTKIRANIATGDVLYEENTSP